MAKEIKDQLTWQHHGLPDLRSYASDFGHDSPDECPAGHTPEHALAILEQSLGFTENGINALDIETPVGTVTVHRSALSHIVQKRRDARERYAKHAVAAMHKPFEVWQVAYDDNSQRLAYIGLFKGKQQMLVVVNIRADGQVLWNFMHCDRKSLNKHRHGEKIFP